MNLTEIGNKLGQNRRWLVIVGVVLALAASFGAGRYTTPTKIVEKEKIVTVTVEKVVTVDHVVEQKVYVEVEKAQTHKETVEVKAPDGTITTKIVEDTKVDTQKTDTDTKVADKTVTDDVQKVNVVEKEKTTTNAKPDWHLRVDVGAGARFVGQLTPTLMLGVGAERRILGPVFMGLWVNTTLNLLAPQTPPYGINAGLSVAVEF